jgi:hypothetical protein
LKWREANREKDLERQKIWYANNKEKAVEYRQRNIDKILKQQKEHYEQNKEKILERCREYYKAHKEEHSTKKRNKILTATDSYLKSLSKLPLPPELAEAVRLKLFIKRKVLELKNETHQ